MSAFAVGSSLCLEIGAQRRRYNKSARTLPGTTFHWLPFVTLLPSCWMFILGRPAAGRCEADGFVRRSSTRHWPHNLTPGSKERATQRLQR